MFLSYRCGWKEIDGPGQFFYFIRCNTFFSLDQTCPAAYINCTSVISEQIYAVGMNRSYSTGMNGAEIWKY